MSLNWSKDYSVGVENLDAQHKEIFEVVGNILKLKSIDRDNLEKTINQLQEYGNKHFSLEESVFLKLDGYRDKEFHVSEHVNYRRIIRGFEAQLEEHSSDELLKEIQKFLEKWWVHHVLDVDKLYAIYIEREEKNK